MRTTYGQIRCHAGARMGRTRPAQGFRPDRPHTRGFASPGFRPGLWSTGPTARPGTGERPVGAPDHSQGRNPWAAKPWAAQIRQTPRDLRGLRKRHGKCRETCAACANATANAERLAQLAQTPRQTPRDLRGLRKCPGKRRETCAACANAPANAARPAQLAHSFSEYRTTPNC